jgi:hypothetical protein
LRNVIAIEMHVTGSKISTKNETASSANDTRKGTVITMALTMTSPTSNIPQPKDAMKGDQSFLARFEEGSLAPEFQAVEN